MWSGITEAVVLVGGDEQRLAPLASEEHPKCLLSVGNTTLLTYALTALKQAGIDKFFLVGRTISSLGFLPLSAVVQENDGLAMCKEGDKGPTGTWEGATRARGGRIRTELQLRRPGPSSGRWARAGRRCAQVVNGERAASKVSKYVQKEAIMHDTTTKVVVAPPDSRSADAVRVAADSLAGEHVVVMSGDTVSDIAIEAVMFAHRIRGAAITTVLSTRPSSAAEGTKIGKAPEGVDYVAIDARQQRLLLFAYDPHTLRRVVLPREAAREYPCVEISTTLCDACIYVLSKAAVAVIKGSNASSIKVCWRSAFEPAWPAHDAARVIATPWIQLRCRLPLPRDSRRVRPQLRARRARADRCAAHHGERAVACGQARGA